MRWLALALLLPTPVLAAPPSPPPPPASYAVKLPPLGDASPQGWGLYAVVKGRSLDLASRGQGWSDDPSAPNSDLEAGYGWWSGRASAIVGYVHHDPPGSGPRTFDAHDPSDHRVRGFGVLGLGLTLRTR